MLEPFRSGCILWRVLTCLVNYSRTGGNRKPVLTCREGNRQRVKKRLPVILSRWISDCGQENKIKFSAIAKFRLSYFQHILILNTLPSFMYELVGPENIVAPKQPGYLLIHRHSLYFICLFPSLQHKTNWFSHVFWFWWMATYLIWTFTSLTRMTHCSLPTLAVYT